MRLHEILMPLDAPIGYEGKKLFHGTMTKVAAISIMKNGLIPGIDKSSTQRGSMVPVRGKVYLTPNLYYAIIYALGGDMAGHDLPARWIENDPYGYVFVIKGDDLGDIEPDEDCVGKFVSDYTKINSNLKTPLEFKHSQDDPQDSRKYSLWCSIRLAMTDKQFRNASQGEAHYKASGGKRALKTLSSYDKRYILSLGSNIAHDGPIKPSECWRFAKKDCPKLLKDCSNFFQLAKQVKRIT